MLQAQVLLLHSSAPAKSAFVFHWNGEVEVNWWMAPRFGFNSGFCFDFGKCVNVFALWVWSILALGFLCQRLGLQLAGIGATMIGVSVCSRCDGWDHSGLGMKIACSTPSHHPLTMDTLVFCPTSTAGHASSSLGESHFTLQVHCISCLVPAGIFLFQIRVFFVGSCV